MHPHAPAETAADEAAPPRRLPLLDVLRGVAILGTFATNVWIFASPGGEGALLSGVALGGDHPLATAFMFLANGKFIAMLTIMFGVGLAIQYRSAAKRGRRWPGRYRWRALFLFVEGTVHFALIFAFDVLMGYAVTAIVVAWLLNRSKRVRRALMWTSLGLHATFMAVLTLALHADPSDAAPPIDPDIEALYASGSWIDHVAFRIDNALAFRAETIIAFPLMMFLFLFGVALFRGGAFGDDERGRRIRNRLMAWGLGVGVPLGLVTAFGPGELFFVERYVAAPFLALGYMGVTGWLVDHVRRGPLMNGLSSLGRCALSGYVLQNLLASAVCYGWGLGLAARFDGAPWFPVALWFAVSALLVAGARVWTSEFPSGPAEMLQKRLMR